MKTVTRPLHNQRGQTLIEYLIIIALVGIGSIALMRAVSKQINSQFTQVVKGLDGNVNGNISKATVNTKHWQNIDMSNFHDAAADSDANKKDK